MGKSHIGYFQAMRCLLIFFLAILLANFIQAADVFENEKVKLGRRTCTCSFKMDSKGKKCAGTAKCDKRCTGTDTVNVEEYSFTLAVKKGKAKISKCKVAAMPTVGPVEPTGTGSGPVEPTGSGSGPVPTGSGEEPIPIGSGTGPVEPTGTGSGSGPVEPTGSGSGPPPITGSGSGSDGVLDLLNNIHQLMGDGFCACTPNTSTCDVRINACIFSSPRCGDYPLCNPCECA